MRQFKINPLVLAIAAVALPATSYAQTQNASTNNDASAIEEIVVTGSFRDSLANALNLKRNSTGSVDSIVAEDIGDFPDNNLADAMQRVPGVNIDRVGGEGKQISVRGLSPDFTRVRVNGMETIATGYNNKGRSFDFNVFASELFSRIDVQKTQSADMEEGSLGATVDLYTAHPLDSDGNSFGVSYSQGYNDRSESWDPRVSALASIQNDEGTLGGALSVAYSKRNVIQEGHNSGRWEANSNLVGKPDHWANAADLPAEINGAVHPRFPRELDRDIDLERLGITGSLQWAPTEDTSLTLDVLHADLTYQQNDITLTPISLARTGDSGRAETTLVDYEYDAATNALTYAQLDGVDVRSENAFVDADTTFDQYSLEFKHDFNDSLRMNALIGQSKSKTEVGEESTISLERFNAGFTYDYRDSTNDPILSYDFDVADPNSWVISEVRDRPADTTNEFKTAQVDFTWDINDIFSLQVGGSTKEFTFDNNQARRDTAILNQSVPQGTSLDIPDGCDVTMDDLNVTSAIGSTYMPSNGQNEFFLPNIDAAAAQVGLFTDDTCFPAVVTTGEDRGVKETDTGYFAQLDFDTAIADMPFRGNLGVRQVKTEQESRGIVSGEDVTVSREYDDTLPSVNLAFDPIDNVTLRASWSEVMTRPSLGSLTPGGSIDGFNRKYTAGNPNLDPFRAKATDLAVEWYFAEESLLSVAWFEKDIESFPSKVVSDVPWASLGLPDSLLDNVPATPQDTFTYSTTGNGEGGKLDGWEVQYQQPFTFGPAWLQNFGIKANYTSIESRVNNGTAAEPVWTSLVGQSDESYNGTLWYENDSGFQGRVSYTYRSGYITSSTSESKAGPGFDTTDETAVVDASLSYQFNDNLKFTLDMLNLTDEPETMLLSDYNLVDTTLKSGRQYYLGAQYTF